MKNIDWQYNQKASTIIKKFLDAYAEEKDRTISNLEALGAALGKVLAMEAIIKTKPKEDIKLPLRFPEEIPEKKKEKTVKKTSRKYQHWTNEDKEKLARLVNEGEFNEKICDEFPHRKKSQITGMIGYLRKIRKITGKRSTASKPGHKWTDEEIKKLETLAEEGRSLKEISEEFDYLSYDQVRSKVKCREIEIKKSDKGKGGGRPAAKKVKIKRTIQGDKWNKRETLWVNEDEVLDTDTIISKES